MSYATVKDTEYWDTWFNTYNKFLGRMKTKKASDYWDRWFEVYSTKLNLLGSTSSVTK
ncbi:MAG: hypothetical protein QNJ38_08170 [Prochloraceae cyanobacterium]|nr:hypothetical protein [Prochloraceae cyanobacterium]